MSANNTHHAKASAKNRKHGRNKRSSGVTGSISTYRLRHAIPEGPRQDLHAEDRCPKHTGRMKNSEHVANRIVRLSIVTKDQSPVRVIEIE